MNERGMYCRKKLWKLLSCIIMWIIISIIIIFPITVYTISSRMFLKALSCPNQFQKQSSYQYITIISSSYNHLVIIISPSYHHLITIYHHHISILSSSYHHLFDHLNDFLVTFTDISSVQVLTFRITFFMNLKKVYLHKCDILNNIYLY